MSTFEIVLEVLKVVIPIIALAFSIFSFIKSIQNQKSSELEANRPQLTLESVMIDVDENDTYVGPKVPWGKKSIVGTIHKDEVLDDKTKRRNTVLDHNGKHYLFVNLCSRKLNDSKNIILSFDVLKIKFTFDTDKVDKLRIKKAYSMLSKEECFGRDIKLDVEFDVRGNELEIPVAYACKDGQDTSIILQKIYNLKEEGKIKLINLSQSPQGADDYIGFKETAYLLQCTTTDGRTYDYSAFVKIDNGEFTPYKIYNGRGLFNKKAREARKEAKRGIVQKSIRHKN